jgi:hypothetical protein
VSETGIEDLPSLVRPWHRIIVAPSGCWEWQGALSSSGYGRCWNLSRRKVVPAHRLAWENAYGPIPDGLDVLHRCDNRPCCNPEHLFLGTDADNAADRDRKGRGGGHRRRGRCNGRAVLTAEQVAEIRLLTGSVSGVELARRFEISPSQIYRVIRKEQWQ